MHGRLGSRSPLYAFIRCWSFPQSPQVCLSGGWGHGGFLVQESALVVPASATLGPEASTGRDCTIGCMWIPVGVKNPRPRSCL